MASLRHVHNIEVFSEERKRSEGWLTISEAAQFLSVADRTLQRAAARAALRAVQPVVNGPWIVHKEDLLAAEPRIRRRQSTMPGADDTTPNQLELEISSS